MFYLRLLFVVLIRFMLFIGLATFAQNFDVSPLPAWTLIAFVYLLHFVITYLSVLWAYRKEILSTRHTVAIILGFTVGEFLLESVLYLYLTHWDYIGLWQSYTWKIVFLFVVYLLGAGAGLYQIRTRRHNAILPATPSL